MPGIVGPIQIVQIFNSGVASVGDRAFISPESSVKTMVGSGTNNTSNYVFVQNPFNISTHIGFSIVGHPIIKNH